MKKFKFIIKYLFLKNKDVTSEEGKFIKKIMFFALLYTWILVLLATLRLMNIFVVIALLILQLITLNNLLHAYCVEVRREIAKDTYKDNAMEEKQ